MDKSTDVNWELLHAHFLAFATEFAKVIRNAAKFLCEAIGDIANSVHVAANFIAPAEVAIENSGYPKQRIIWLALHHKSYRVRKKNRKRIMKWLEENK